jgi:hypothetical protein
VLCGETAALDDVRQRYVVTGGALRRLGHRGSAGVDGVDDLGVVDALQIDRSDAQVGVPELALDDDRRDALAGHLDGVRVAELMRCQAWADTGPGGGLAEFSACGAR